ncbi:MAG: dihydropteroate synthase-like protein [Candidatus Jordarchaeaceae archaeon]
MRVLLVTGRLAKESVERAASQSSLEVDVVELPVSVAAFLSPDFIVKQLKNKISKKYDLLIVPGLVKGDVSIIEDELKIPTFKGPRYASDIPLILDNLDIPLSKIYPADYIIKKSGIEDYQSSISQLEKTTIENSRNFKIGRGIKPVYVGLDFPPRVLAEIVDAPKLDLEKVVSTAEYYIGSGASIIDVGAVVGEDNSSKLGEIVSLLKEKFLVPVSIDSMLPSEIEAGVEAGADLVLSMDQGNIEELKSLPKNVGVVLLPTNVKMGFLPKTARERVENLLNLYHTAERYGFKKIIVDPLLESPISPGLSKSLESYILFRRTNQSLPMMFGVGNVTEFMDVDSVGVNGLLACLAVELGVSLLLTTEHSVKTRRSVYELSRAIMMAFLASKRDKTLKDLGLTLLKSKSKTDYVEPRVGEIEVIETDVADESYVPDPKGYFKIWVNHEEGKLYVLFSDSSSNRELLLKGLSAEALGKKIISLGLVSRMDHALYLGRELSKAETCLLLGKSYAQDLNIFGEDE